MPGVEKRPKFLNLFQIHMPVGAVASIAHRIAGALLFLVMPAAVFLLELSLRGPEGFEQAQAILQSQLAKVAGIVLAWALLHHLLAGIRFLLLDFEIGVSRERARMTAWLVNFGAPVLLLIIMGLIL
jgi:succinate dehydrogenase / fumarate reductase cytochrome b subunit